MKKLSSIILFILTICLINNICYAGISFDIERMGYQRTLDVAYNGNVCIAVGEKGQILASDDFVNWQFCDIGTYESRFKHVFWTGESFVALMEVVYFDENKNYTKYSKIYTSDNGYEWSVQVELTEAIEGDVCYLLNDGNLCFDYLKYKDIKRSLNVIDQNSFKTIEKLSLPNDFYRIINFDTKGGVKLNSQKIITIDGSEYPIPMFNYENIIPDSIQQIGDRQEDFSFPGAYYTSGGYITQINGVKYLVGKKGNRYSSLPTEIYNEDGTTHQIEWFTPKDENGNNIEFIYENSNLMRAADMCGFDIKFDPNTKSTRISTDRVYGIYVDIPFRFDTGGRLDPLYWEDDSYLYIQSQTIRLKTLKQPLYDELSKIQESPYVVFDNKLLCYDVPPVIKNGYTLVPIRFLFEQMGADVTWNQQTQTATVTQDNTAITFGIDDINAIVNGSNVSMDIPARLINNKTMVPVRFLSEELGYTVNWDGENRIITIK